MRASDQRPSAEATERVGAPPEQVWDLIADLPAMGRWSPECESCEWLGGASGPAIGVRFRGKNRNEGKRWSTVSTIVECDHASVLTWEVKAGPFRIARWSYALAPDGSGGCEVTERWFDQRSAWMVPLGKLASGVGDRAPHNLEGMRETLARLKAAAEG
ncbi:MAG: SRPBCC family protein [Acidimicrobiales bacterium]